MVSVASDSADDDDAGFRLGHFRDGVSVATIRWIDLGSPGVNIDSVGVEHERQTSDEAEAVALLAWIAKRPDMMLISQQVRY